MDVFQLSIPFSQLSFELILQTLLVFLHLPCLIIITPLRLSNIPPNVGNVLIQLLQLSLNFPMMTLTLINFASSFLDLLSDGSDPLTRNTL